MVFPTKNWMGSENDLGSVFVTWNQTHLLITDEYPGRH